MNISDKLFVLQDCHLGNIMHLIQSVQLHKCAVEILQL